MKNLVVALAVMASLSMTAPADAATAYMLNYTQFNPYQHGTVAGPFDTLQECSNVRWKQTYTPGVTYSCDIIYY